MRTNTDAARKILKLFIDVYPERIANGQDGFVKKDWYVLGLNLGIIFNSIATKGNHEELVDTTPTV